MTHPNPLQCDPKNSPEVNKVIENYQSNKMELNDLSAYVTMIEPGYDEIYSFDRDL